MISWTMVGYNNESIRDKMAAEMSILEDSLCTPDP